MSSYHELLENEVLASDLESLSEEIIDELADSNEKSVRLANHLRLSVVNKPGQSNFRVIAFLFIDYEINSKSKLRKKTIICGSNCEPGNISGSICAERAALCRLQFYRHPQIFRILVLTDSPHAIAPGPLCREFLSSHASMKTPLIIGNDQGSIIIECTLEDIFPFPYRYRYVDRQRVLSLAQEIATKVPYAMLCSTSSTTHSCEAVGSTEVNEEEKSTTTLYYGISEADGVSNLPHSMMTESTWLCTLSDHHYETLLTAAYQVNHYDHLDGIHPLRFSAAVLYSNGETYSTWQLKGLEYGCTSDPLEAVIHHILHHQTTTSSMNNHNNNNNSMNIPIAVVMIDQYRICHAPFSKVRCLLIEHGLGDIRVVIHILDNQLIDVPAHCLLPSPPNASLLSHDDFV
jgi:cytidine deaminase